MIGAVVEVLLIIFGRNRHGCLGGSRRSALAHLPNLPRLEKEILELPSCVPLWDEDIPHLALIRLILIAVVVLAEWIGFAVSLFLVLRSLI